MTQKISNPESFLSMFHNKNPGITSRAISDLTVQIDGRRFSSSYECLANEIPEFEGPRTLLDLACGDGYLLSRFAARGQSDLSLMGVDLSEGELCAARLRLGNSATLTQGRAQALPIATASLDYVVSHMALMLMDEIEEVLAQVRRVMKRGGIFAAIVGTRPPQSAVFDAYLELLSQYPRKEQFGGLRFGDSRMRSRDGIIQLLSNGFDSIVVQDVLVRRRYTPGALCAWLEDTYDFHMLDAGAQKEFNSKFIKSIEKRCDNDGKVEYTNFFYLFNVVNT